MVSTEKVNVLREDARSLVRELGLLNDAYFDVGVTLAERHLLIELASFDRPTMGEIGERLLIDKSTVSRLIAKAVKKGYIKCSSDKKDRRKRYLEFTALGKKTLQTFEPIAHDQTKAALQTLAPDEVKLVYQGVSLYAKGLKNSRLGVTSTPHKMEPLDEIYKQLETRGFTLRPYQSKDEEAFYEIFREVVDSGCQFPYENNTREEFHQQFLNARSHNYVCVYQGKIVGGFYLRANYSGRSAHIANAAYMIKGTHRGHGLGTLLVKASLHLAKELGFRAMQFNMVLSQNTVAVKLYQKLGFTIAGTLPDAVRNPDGTFQDGYVMHRHL